MILGTCNMGFAYNGPQLTKKDSFKILAEFQKLGGGIIDTAVNYHEAHNIINEYVKVNGQENLKIQSKVYYYSDFNIIFEELKDCKIYSILYRNYNEEAIIERLKTLKRCKEIEKYGQSIYYPHELRQEANIIQTPCNDLFEEYYITMNLFGDIQIRSLYNLAVKNCGDKNRVLKWAKELKECYSKIDYVIGVDNIEQLRENVELFG